MSGCGSRCVRGWRLAVGGVLAVLLAAPVRAEPAEVPPPALELVHEDRLEAEGFWLSAVEYLLDGQPLSPQAEGAGNQRVVTPGRHVLDVRGVYVGRSPVFEYVTGYRFVMRGRVTFEARPGWIVRIRSTGLVNEGLTVRWEQRPAFKLEGEPRRAILSIESGPVEQQPLVEVASPGDALPHPDQERAEEKARQVIDEVLAEARRRAPLATCALEPIYFDFADTRLKPETEALLRRLSACLLRQPSLRLRIQGHCDARGAESFNDNLGQGRAQTVAAYLLALGVPRSRLSLETEGAAQPVCDEPSEACYAKSRRVELIADPGSP